MFAVAAAILLVAAQDVEVVSRCSVAVVNAEAGTATFQLKDGTTLNLKIGKDSKFLDDQGFPIKPSDFKKKDRVQVFYFEGSKVITRARKLE